MMDLNSIVYRSVCDMVTLTHKEPTEKKNGYTASTASEMVFQPLFLHVPNSQLRKFELIDFCVNLHDVISNY